MRGGHAGHVQVFETDIYEKMRNATNIFSKLYSQPRTHKGATREANTIASQKSAPLNTGLSIMFEIFTIYPGHSKRLHGHTSRLRFGGIQPRSVTTNKQSTSVKLELINTNQPKNKIKN